MRLGKQMHMISFNHKLPKHLQVQGQSGECNNCCIGAWCARKLSCSFNNRKAHHMPRYHQCSPPSFAKLVMYFLQITCVVKGFEKEMQMNKSKGTVI